jgi:hypothetical protein
VALLEKRRFLYNHSGDFPQVILIVPSHVPNNYGGIFVFQSCVAKILPQGARSRFEPVSYRYLLVVRRDSDLATPHPKSPTWIHKWPG